MLYKYLVDKPFYIEDVKVAESGDILDIYNTGVGIYTVVNNDVTCKNIRTPIYIDLIEKCKEVND